MSETRQEIIARVTAQWQREQPTPSPDPAYSKNGRSQYPEGIIALSAPQAAVDTLHRRVIRALKKAGLPEIP